METRQCHTTITDEILQTVSQWKSYNLLSQACSNVFWDLFPICRPNNLEHSHNNNKGRYAEVSFHSYRYGSFQRGDHIRVLSSPIPLRMTNASNCTFSVIFDLGPVLIMCSSALCPPLYFHIIRFINLYIRANLQISSSMLFASRLCIGTSVRIGHHHRSMIMSCTVSCRGIQCLVGLWRTFSLFGYLHLTDIDVDAKHTSNRSRSLLPEANHCCVPVRELSHCIFISLFLWTSCPTRLHRIHRLVFVDPKECSLLFPRVLGNSSNLCP